MALLKSGEYIVEVRLAIQKLIIRTYKIQEIILEFFLSYVVQFEILGLGLLVSMSACLKSHVQEETTALDLITYQDRNHKFFHCL